MAKTTGRLLVIGLALAASLISCVCAAEEKEKKEYYIPKCSSSTATSEEESNSYCDCITVFPTNRGTVSIMCDFNHTENVLLTEALYPFRNSSLGSAYVRVVNATSVHVTKEFLTEFMQSPSIALDIWRAQTLILDSMPDPEPDKFKNYKTFVGVGILSCYVPEIPKYFLRDRTRGGFRIKSSHVGIFRQGALHNMEQMRYLVIRDSTVDLFEGSVATEGIVTLSQRNLHAWSGLVLSNVTIETVNSGTFNITHMSDMETTMLVDSKIGSLNSKAFVVEGDIDVTIKNNVFYRMEKEAVQVAVTGDVIFDKNDISNWEPDALEGLVCHKRTSLEENTFRVNDPTDIAINSSSTPFHASCGNPQLFLVISPQHPLAIQVSTTSSWSLGAVLFILVVGVIVAAVYSHQKQNLLLHFYRSRGRMPLSSLRERKLSQENLPNGAEIDPSAEVTEDGMSNPIYVDVNESS